MQVWLFFSLKGITSKEHARCWGVSHPGKAGNSQVYECQCTFARARGLKTGWRFSSSTDDIT